MPLLAWDKVGERKYESGLDRGVLYLSDGSAIPWSGLTSVVVNPGSGSESVYYDGMKVNEVITVGNFKATMKAVTYPNEFEELEGQSYDSYGVMYNNQPPRSFNLTYRTQVKTDTDIDYGYKINLIYNLTAVPSDKTYASEGEDPSLVEFEWEITAVPQEVPGHRPTAHITIDSRKIDPLLLIRIEEILYGSNNAFPLLPPMEEFLSLLVDWYRIAIIDHGDGTWSAISEIPGLVVDNGDGTFEINEIDAIYFTPEMYQISTTRSAADVPIIALDVFPDGVWTATAVSDALIDITPEGIFTIYNVDAEFAGADMYRIKDTY